MAGDELRQLIELAKEHQLKRLKVDEIEFEFFSLVDQQAVSFELPKESQEPSPEERLFWSSGLEPASSKGEDDGN